MTPEMTPYQPLTFHLNAPGNRPHALSLVLCYQPLVGTEALGVYHTFFELAAMSSTPQQLRHKDLLPILGLGMEAFNALRHRLEAVGLIETYLDTASHVESCHQAVIYRIYTGLSVTDFMRHPLLNNALYKQLGDASYQLLSRWVDVEEATPPSWQARSASFKDVFGEVEPSVASEAPTSLPESNHRDIDLRLHTESGSKQIPESLNQNIHRSDSLPFSYSQFLSVMMDDGINHQLLTQRLEAEVHALYQNYQFPFEVIVSLIQSGLNATRDTLDYVAVMRNARQLSQERTPVAQQPSSLKDVAKEIQLRQESLRQSYSELSEADIQLMALCEAIPPITFLKKAKKEKKGFTTKGEIQHLKHILNLTALPAEVINYMVYYLLFHQQKSILNKWDLEGVANDWQQRGIRSLVDALSYTRQSNAPTQSSKSSAQRATYREPIPKWFQEETSPSTQHSEPMNDTDQARFQSIMNRINQT